LNMKVTAGQYSGKINAISSKSDAHRILICAALSGEYTDIAINNLSADIECTMDCLKSMGAKIEKQAGGLWRVYPVWDGINKAPVLDCRESGSTLRFLLPLAAAVCAGAGFTGEGRLPGRPLSPLKEEMMKKGCVFSGNHLPMNLSGKLESGIYYLPGDISSQFITGLLFALPLLEGDSEIRLTTKAQSAGYINMTLYTLSVFNIRITYKDNCFYIKGNQKYLSPKRIAVEGDWSNAAFWLSAGAVSGNISVSGLNIRSNQGDKEILSLLSGLGADVVLNEDIKVSSRKLTGIEINAENIPDLVPVLSAVAAVSEGTTIIRNVERLRIKESDRITAIIQNLTGLGAYIYEENSSLIIKGKPFLSGGTVSGFNDHRIVMSMAVISAECQNPVVITGAEAVNKSYPLFFEDFKKLGGNAVVI
jgi:3-phosphoshikimate 1-carboxyvinyltransferase